jgi:pyruvate dehydrogenase E1 component
MSEVEPEQILTLEEIELRVLWLAVRMIDFANHDRENHDGVKVGGHQASSASMVTVMTALYFAHLEREDRVAVKPHASPVFHAIQYLLGNLDRSFLKTLREKGGLQSYPSRTKDPDGVDFSTGSVGLGAAAPLFAAVARRYVDSHFSPRPTARYVSLIGDAELDEGNIWEAIADPATQGLGNVMWVVDFNRQSLDRVVPGTRIQQWRGQFEAAGWHVEEVKYGRRLEEAFARKGGSELRQWIDDMPNDHYQSLFGLTPAALRVRFLEGAPDSVAEFVAEFSDEELAGTVTDLGGHDLEALLLAFQRCDLAVARPSIVFAYTVKGWGLPNAGHPRNHSGLLTAVQINALRESVGLTLNTEWDGFATESVPGRLIRERHLALARTHSDPKLPIKVPFEMGLRSSKSISTQEAFGRVLVDLSRNDEVRPYLVTTAPDVATSTNLGGFINRVGVFHPAEQQNWHDDALMRWVEGPTGQHIELGISEMNLFLLLGQLGLAWDLSGQPLLALGTVYDPFVLRGLDALLYSVYSGAKFIVAGTPSGVTLAAEGGAHQSTITPSVGLELPGITMIEPAYASALDWLMCDSLGRIAGHPVINGPLDDGAYYFRLTTRPLDQSAFDAARLRVGDAVLRRQVIAGGYRLVDAFEVHGDLHELRESGTHIPVVNIVASGAVMPEALKASEALADEGVAAHVVDVTSNDRLYSSWQLEVRHGLKSGRNPSAPSWMSEMFPQRGPVVTVHDAASHSMAWLAGALGVNGISIGVDSFGQSGSVKDLYELHDLTPNAILNGAMGVLSLQG